MSLQKIATKHSTLELGLVDLNHLLTPWFITILTEICCQDRGTIYLTLKIAMIDTMSYPQYLSNSARQELSEPRDLLALRATQTVLEFNTIVQTNLFNKLKKQEFTGKIVLDTVTGFTSILYFYMGRLIYAEGGVHPRRRWQRHLKDYCPGLLEQQGLLLPQDSCPVGQEYALLGKGIQEQIIHREQVIYLIRSVISEVLFDLTQQGKVTYKLRPDKYFIIPIVAINPEQIVTLVNKQWQAWQDARLGDRSPNFAPIVKSLEALEKRTSAITFRCLCQRLNGKNTLRDLAIDLNQDLLRLTQSLMLYVQWGLVDLIAIPDLPDGHSFLPSQEQKKLIIYVTSAGENSQRLGTVLATQGYELLAVQQDSLDAIALCLDKKPAAILLSAQLNPLDGYEICYQLRQVAIFRHKPIFVITEQKGIKDKIRAKMVGASEVLDKSTLLYSTVFLLNKHLEENKTEMS